MLNSSYFLIYVDPPFSFFSVGEMSDAEQDEEKNLENPDPESESIAEASGGDLNVESESVANSNQNCSPGNAPVERNTVSENVAASASNGSENERDTNESDVVVGSDNPEGFSINDNQAEAEGHENELNCQDSSLTEGDQNQCRSGELMARDLAENQNVESAEDGHDMNDLNEYAAEDEQYFPLACAGADSSVSLQPEGDIVLCDQNDGDAEGAVGASLEEEQSVSSHRTESCCQLDEYASQQHAAGSQDEVEDGGIPRNPLDVCEADGASASGQDISLAPESELEESRSQIIHERDNEPTESDGEAEVEEHNIIDGAGGGNVNENQNDVPDGEVNGAEGNDDLNIAANEDNVEVSENVLYEEKNVPEDEISVVSIGKPESYQPECDQSEGKDLQPNTGVNVEGASNPNVDNQVTDSSENDGSSTVMKFDPEKSGAVYSDRNAAGNEDLDGNSNNCDKNKPEDERTQRAEIVPNECVNALEAKNLKEITKETGAIPKNRTQHTDVSSLSKTVESKPSQRQNVDVDSEDELLSELDATLKSNSVDTSASSNSDKCAISHSEQTVKDGNPDSCDQCLRNNLQCSFKGSHHEKGGNSNIPGVKDLKKQLHQAKQMLLDRECEISR